VYEGMPSWGRCPFRRELRRRPHPASSNAFFVEASGTERFESSKLAAMIALSPFFSRSGARLLAEGVPLRPELAPT